jgi:hypothetical protein
MSSKANQNIKPSVVSHRIRPPQFQEIPISTTAVLAKQPFACCFCTLTQHVRAALLDQHLPRIRIQVLIFILYSLVLLFSIVASHKCIPVRVRSFAFHLTAFFVSWPTVTTTGIN